ncbi:hypothetical protein QQ045_001452 [Rhodiola kirilowii]
MRLPHGSDAVRTRLPHGSDAVSTRLERSFDTAGTQFRHGLTRQDPTRMRRGCKAISTRRGRGPNTVRTRLPHGSDAVSTRLQRRLNTDATRFPHGSDAVSTRLQRSFNTDATRFRHGFHTVTTRLRRNFNTTATRFRRGFHTVPTRFPHGSDAVSTRMQRSFNTDATRFRHGFHTVTTRLRRNDNTTATRFGCDCHTVTTRSQHGCDAALARLKHRSDADATRHLGGFERDDGWNCFFINCFGVFIFLILASTPSSKVPSSLPPSVAESSFFLLSSTLSGSSSSKDDSNPAQDVSKVYKSEFELESYIRSDIYGAHVQLNNSSNPKIRGAVVFHCQGPQLFDYGIRLNHTWAFSGVPDVKSIMDSNGPYLNDLELGVNIVPTLQYGFSGFLTLQQILDSFIIFVAQQTAADIGTFLALQVTNVFEKEQKIREGLCMMGLKDEVFHISWLLIYSLQFAISAAIITVSAMSSLFKYSDKIFIILASLLSPTALALGSINFVDYDRAHVGLRWSNMWRASSGVNFLLCLLMMVFDSLLYCALGLYCDKVLRGENGTQNLWNYLFQKGSLKTKSTKVNQSPKPEVNIRDNLLKDQLIPYCVHTSETSVESISLEMKQQELDEANQKSTICRLSTSPQSIVIQVLLPTVVMLMLIAIFTLSSHQLHGSGIFVKACLLKWMFIKCTSLSLSSKAIYIRIFMEPMFNSITCQNPKIRGAVVFHGQGPQLFDYSIRLNQTWDFSGFPDVKSIMDTNGEEFPSKGTATIFGIKGVSEKRMENVVMEKIVEFDLLKHADKPSFCLSRGNKRKLSVAVAMIGDPPIVILDEPSTDFSSPFVFPCPNIKASLLDEEVVQIFIKLDEERRKERENEERRKGTNLELLNIASVNRHWKPYSTILLLEQASAIQSSYQDTLLLDLFHAV